MIADAKGVITGLAAVQDGAQQPLAVGRYNELLVGSVLPRASELALRGMVFSAAVVPGTGVAPGASISTTAAFTLHNPSGSGKNLVILTGSCGYKSGTLSAGTIVWAANTLPVTTPPSGTACTVVKTLISSSTSGAVGLPTFTTTIVTPTILRPAFNLGAALASTAGIWPSLIDKVDGEFVVAPGCSISLMGVTAAESGSPLVILGMSWAEVPV